ncbi:S1-like domain-containing RNA-binding protein [Helicobacter sp. MIT 14-3879]|uniref:S1-like domain-containing RNA-binding protein n=1 Tax=Helicobacter sp. MIT 14-3879 TaxID=2040649 RepID=UPI000E1EF20D|nr:S1-like domain-containing RNA-binding protein [Helicobacter sp. MIT 14-3879]RDU65039.1 hypothetical protein CQA44_01640 [Helicobacter sp. MIT 14-3879]
MQFLKVARFSKNGAYLIDETKNEVLLPNKYLNDNIKLDSLVWVFIYTDSNDRLVAITTMPKGLLGDILTLEVKSISSNGIYLDLGIPKDLFMPSKNPTRFKVGQKVVIKITLDKQGRLIAKQNLQDYLLKLNLNSKLKKVKILPFMKTNIGINCVINNKYFGIIHNNDINKEVNIGEEIEAIIKKIRNDGKADLGLKNDFKIIEKNILDYIFSNSFLKLNFNSSSEDIYKLLKISKKSFKIATTRLIKDKKIRFIKENKEMILVKF